MSSSSQPSKSLEDYLKEIVVSDTIDLSGITIDSGNTMSDSMYTTFDNDVTITLSGGAAQSTYTIGSTDTITIESFNNIFGSTEWEDAFPDWHRVQDMCEKYPGLKIAFDNFKVFYEMVKDDYDNPKDKK